MTTVVAVANPLCSRCSDEPAANGSVLCATCAGCDAAVFANAARKKRRRSPKPPRFVVLYAAEPGLMPDPIFRFESAEDDALTVAWGVIPAGYRERCRVIPEREWLEIEAARKRDSERARRAMKETRS